MTPTLVASRAKHRTYSYRGREFSITKLRYNAWFSSVVPRGVLLGSPTWQTALQKSIDYIDDLEDGTNKVHQRTLGGYSRVTPFGIR